MRPITCITFSVLSTLLLLSCLLVQSGYSQKCLESEMEEATLKIVGYVSDNRYQYPKSDREFTKFCT